MPAIEFDNQLLPVMPTFVLCTKNAKCLCKLPVYNVTYSNNFNSTNSFVAYVSKFDNCKRFKFWDEIKDFRLVWIKEWNEVFEIAVQVDEGDGTVKTINGTSLAEVELGQILLHNIEINTEDDIARDDYVPTKLYDEDNPEASLLHRITDKVPHYNIVHVDLTLQKLQRTFTFDDKSIYDSLQDIATELNCYVHVSVKMATTQSKFIRNIALYDLYSNCKDCGCRGEFLDVCPECGSKNIDTGYGKDTCVYVSTENLADDIKYSVDTGSVKNCFYLKGGDDLMTATIKTCNPNGSQYMWYITDEQKHDMSSELVSRIDSYDRLFTYYNKENQISLHLDAVSSYNKLVAKYQKAYSDYYVNDSKNLERIKISIAGYSNLIVQYYNTIDFGLFLEHAMMPSPTLSDTTAKEQAAALTADSIGNVAAASDAVSATTADSIVLKMVKLVVDARYQVVIKTSSFVNMTWTGSFTITNYSDEEDTADSATISLTLTTDYATYIQNAIDKVAAKKADDIFDIVKIMKMSDSDFSRELTKYCLSSLQTFYDCCEDCINVMISQNVHENAAVKASLYDTYRNKLDLVTFELNVRQREVDSIVGVYDEDGKLIQHGMQNLLNNQRIKIQNVLNFENYIGDYWEEFCSFRREDTFSNTNYISDGLDNADLVANALEFIQVAQNEIYKSAMLQHSISADLKNLLCMPEFSPIVNADNFEIGNWIRVRVDEKLYRLRLIGYSISFNDLTSIDVDFSDVIQVKDGVSDVQSILSKASSMATSYGSVSRQASKGEESDETITGWSNDGLSMTNIKIVNNAQDQNMQMTNSGMLFRLKDPYEESYSPCQTKIINNGLYVTDDNWRTIKSGIGKFIYNDPENDFAATEGYGLIADTVVGNLILGNNLGIYNSSGSLKFTQNGLEILSDQTSGETSPVISVSRKTASGIESLLKLEENGNFTVSRGTITGSTIIGSRIQNANNTAYIDENGTINGMNIQGKNLRITADQSWGDDGTGDPDMPYYAQSIIMEMPEFSDDGEIINESTEGMILSCAYQGVSTKIQIGSRSGIDLICDGQDGVRANGSPIITQSSLLRYMQAFCKANNLKYVEE